MWFRQAMMFNYGVMMIILLLLCPITSGSEVGNQTEPIITIDDNVDIAVKAYMGGFHSYRSNKLLQSMLSTPEIQMDTSYDNNNYKLQLLNINDKMKILLSNDDNYHDYDLGFVYINNYELINDNVILERFQLCFESIIECSNSKTPLVIIFSGLSQEADKVEYLLKEAWVLLDKDKYRGTIKDDSLFTKFDVQIILTPPSYLREDESVNIEAIKAVRDALNEVSIYGKPVQNYLQAIQYKDTSTNMSHNNNNLTSSQIQIETTTTATKKNSNVNNVIGIELFPSAVSHALDWALKATNDSIVRLNKLERPENFAGFIENLIKASNDVLSDEFKAAYASNTSRGDSSDSVPCDYSNVLSIARQELNSKIYLRLAPLYKRQVQLLRNEVANSFNDIVTNKIEVSIYVMEDLYEARDNTVSNFTSLLRRLTPKNAPTSRWNADFEIFELKQTLDDFLAARKSSYQLSGIYMQHHHHHLIIIIIFSSYFILSYTMMLQLMMMMMVVVVYVMMMMMMMNASIIFHNDDKYFLLRTICNS